MALIGQNLKDFNYEQQIVKFVIKLVIDQEASEAINDFLIFPNNRVKATFFISTHYSDST